MYDHIGLRVKDLKAAVRFYKSTLEPLGHVLDDSGVGFGPRGQPALWLHADGQSGSGTHVAFRAADRKAVDRFHAAGLKAGGRDNGKPSRRSA
jgi:catechol 2,3-dioxygenase-like lactoylglutathione lyase family enzyme